MNGENIKRFVHPCATLERFSECLKLIFGVTDSHIAKILYDYQLEYMIAEHGGCVLFADIAFLERLTKSRRGTFKIQEGFR
ncbi:MAG: hypothetical protein IJU48_09995 [Synergistaceae bacterium]|nr:hypothetical protein [Synergistaceae bacterium]